MRTTASDGAFVFVAMRWFKIERWRATPELVEMTIMKSITKDIKIRNVLSVG
jgi:hypothetical protein